MDFNPKLVHTKVLKQSLSRLGLTNSLRPILNQIAIWVNSNGEEWTVDRLKHLKVILIKLRAGENVT